MNPSPIRKLRIQLVLPFLNLTGGNKTVMEVSNRLAARGHDVWLIYAQTDVPWWKPRGFTRIKLRDWGARPWVDWFDVRVPVVRCPGLEDRYVPEADVVMATCWSNAHAVAALSSGKGKKLYYVQAYETDWIKDTAACDDGYRLPMRQVVNASWLGRLMWEKFAQPSVKIVPPIDYEQYVLRPQREFRRPPRCLLLYHTLEVKGAADGIAAFERAAREVPGMTLTLYGTRSVGLQTPHRVAGMVPESAMADLYHDHDIFIWPSHREGLGAPPMEAMACQCAVATTDNGGSEEFAFHEKTALVSPPRDVKALAENIQRLATDVELRKRLAHNGCDWVHNHINWEYACGGFERCFMDDTLWKGPNSPALPEES
ncbi:MAG: glycosyltransferase family 4 protein [Verrucomicrobiia bacterium]|jgi:hypothetical protein